MKMGWACLFLALPLCLSAFSTGTLAVTANFNENFEVSWAPTNVKFLGGESLQLVLDQSTGSGFASKESYLFGDIDMQIKLVPGDSAGTVTAYYLSSEGAKHDELDFEFLGNASGQPYVLQTNVFSAGVGGREQRITLWFDPTQDFHTYSVNWSAKRVVFLVDGVPIRVFSNNEAVGVPYLRQQAMRVYSSIWNGDSWATQGGLLKINWANAPFVATYRNFGAANACRASTPAAASACVRAAASNHISGTGGAAPSFDRNKLQWVKKNFMVYDYCTDSARYRSAPAECTREL
ncbi:hypothetical protein GOP47_0005463 [Adiantum capillus-veneris]|uniref:Xyloglucan endotransglucosylase/hydrolase n=1 Tax=Adiantum capillus-veneris TaxID=13818 RepID=A0A9D4V5L3_ADICA|nr:hypothetical protein GOP47_0005463 [Adiantum capillus-veneris]